MGPMQIIPKTYAGLRDDRHLGSAPNNPRDNILAGAAYLREMFDSYGSPGFLAAYNAGPARHEDHLATGRPLPVATLAYVAMLSPKIGAGRIDDTKAASFDLLAWARAILFAARSETPLNTGMPATNVQPDRPRKVRRIVDLSALAPQSDGLFVRLASEAPQQ